jgi:hypothetical protein
LNENQSAMRKTLFIILMPLILGLAGCEGGIDLTGSEQVDKGVNVNMNIVMNNAHTDAVYLLLENEAQDGTTLVASNSSRSLTDGINLPSDSRYEHTYSMVFKARWGEGNYVETTHVVDYKKYELNFDGGLDEPPTLSLRITVTFDGSKLTVNEVQQ